MYKIRVGQLTVGHPHDDIRIFEKVSMSLRDANYDVELLCKNAGVEELNNIRIHPIISRNKIERILIQFKFIRKSLKEKYQVVHFHDPELLFTGLALKLLGKKVIYDVHEDYPLQVYRKPFIPEKLKKPISVIVNFIEKQSAKRFDKLVCATDEIERKFKKYNEKTTVVRNFPRLGMFYPKGYNNKEGVCYAGGISESRGLSRMLEASEIANVPIFLAGNSIDNEFKEKISKSDLFNHLGYLSKEEVNNLYNRSICGLVVLENIEAYRKALPIKMFEYMSAGIPVICSDFPMWREIIENNNCGICVDQDDPNSIAKAIKYFVDNPQEARIMGENGRDYVVNELNWNKESEKLLDVYTKLTSESEVKMEN